MSEDVDDQIAALYQGDNDAFIADRKTLAARLKKEGHVAASTRVAALTKPTPSAWATNRVSVTARHAFVSSLKQGAALRNAMARALRGESGTDVAALQREQRESIEAVVGEAARLLSEAGLPSKRVVLDRVRTNITTISMTGRWGDAPSARLSKDLEPLDIGALATLLDTSGEDGAIGSSAKAPAPTHVSPVVALKKDNVAATAKPAKASAAKSHSEKNEAARQAQHAEAKRLEEERARAEEAEKKRLHREKVAALHAEMAEAEALREEMATRADLLRDQTALATKALASAEKRHQKAEAEAERLATLAEEAREAATLARRDLDTEASELAIAQKTQEKAAHDEQRAESALLLLRDRLAHLV